MNAPARTRPVVVLAALVLAAGALLLAAAPVASAATARRVPAAVKGCGADSWTDPADDSASRQPARCAPNTPAPKPLAERKTLQIGVNNLSSEYIAVLRYAIAEGEFDKENLEVELKVVPSADAYTQTAAGELDGAFSAANAGMINAVKAGFDLRWVFGNYSPDPASKTGLWVSANNGKAKSLKALAGAKIASVAGPGSIIDYPIHEALVKAGIDSSDVQLSVLAPQDIVTALQNGSFEAGWVVDPLWLPLTKDPDLALAIGQPAGEPLGGMIMGPSLLKDDRKAGLAFVRAYIRTLNTYFAGDYKQDPKFVAKLSSLIGVPEAQLQQTPSLVWDWEIRAKTIGGIQKAFIAEDALTDSDPLPASKLVDRSLYEQAVGHSSS